MKRRITQFLTLMVVASAFYAITHRDSLGSPNHDLVKIEKDESGAVVKTVTSMKSVTTSIPTQETVETSTHVEETSTHVEEEFFDIEPPNNDAEDYASLDDWSKSGFDENTWVQINDSSESYVTALLTGEGREKFPAMKNEIVGVPAYDEIEILHQGAYTSGDTSHAIDYIVWTGFNDNLNKQITSVQTVRLTKVGDAWVVDGTIFPAAN